MGKSKHSEFFEVMRNNFYFLLSTYGYTIEEPFEDYVELKSNKCKVVIIARNGMLEVSIAPLGDTAQLLSEKNLKTNSIELESIVRKFAPHEKFEKSYSVYSIDEVEAEVKYNSALLRKYCMELVAGDLSEWVRIRTL